MQRDQSDRLKEKKKEFICSRDSCVDEANDPVKIWLHPLDINNRKREKGAQCLSSEQSLYYHHSSYVYLWRSSASKKTERESEWLKAKRALFHKS